MKIGDKVVLLKNVYSGENLSSGKTGVIMNIEYDELYQVALDSGYASTLDGTPLWNFYDHELEVVE